MLSTPQSKRRPTRALSTFSTSTPARSQSPQMIPAFESQSLVATQLLSQPCVPVTPALSAHGYPPNPTWEDMRPTESVLEMEEDDALQAARGCFETRDFVHVIHILKDCKSSKAQFLNVYCKFIVSLNANMYRTNSQALIITRQVKRRLNETGTNWIVRTACFNCFFETEILCR